MDNFFTNHVTLENFPLTFNGSCNTKNCVYVIKCTHAGCNYQYVGHTINTIKARVSQHKSTIIKGGGCRVLREHFTEVHSTDNLSIMPIALLPDNTSLKEREDIEDTWMLKLNTLYPYGLNLRAKKVGVMDSSNLVMSSKDTVYSKFNVVKISRHTRGGVHTNQNGNSATFCTDTFFDNLVNNPTIDFHSLRTTLAGIKKVQLKMVYIQAISQTSSANTEHLHRLLLVKDLAWFYLRRMGVGVKKPKSNFFLVVNYVNKHVEYINFRKIFSNSDVSAASPFKSDNISAPSISYHYPKTIRSKVLNYKEAYDNYCDPNTLSCDCNSSAYRDSHHKHVITGDLSFIKDVRLRTLLSKGLNYRDQAPPSVKAAFNAVKTAVNDYCKILSDRYKKPIVMFTEWKSLILDKVKLQLLNCKPFPYNTTLSDGKVLKELSILHDKFVLVPTDKAANNVTIVCKKFYISLIKQEIESNTFEPVNCSIDSIITQHENFMLEHGIKLLPKNRKLPYLYITPKQHKSPVGFRFITSGAACSLQQLSKYVGICLKSLLHSAKNRSLYDNKFHPRNDFYVIDNHEPVLDFLNSNNLKNGYKSIHTFDFSTLYTSIPHDQLKDNLFRFINRVFDFKDKPFITPNIYTKKAYFSLGRSSNKISFSKDGLIECLNYLIDNAYITYQGKVYRQVIGIPMGTNAGPQIANTYLHVYEYDYIRKLIEDGDEVSLKKLENIFRYQDDLISINDDGLLGDLLTDIYPKEMIVNGTNVSPRKCNYLDMSISIYRGKFRVSLYDKRKDYDFNVISYPFLEGNIPNNLSYSVFISQLVRFAKINTTVIGFYDNIADLVKKLICQGFNLAALRKKFLKFYHSKLDLWCKFGVDIYEHVINLFT